LSLVRSLLVATRNESKLSELQYPLSDLSFAICSLRDFPAVRPVEETGRTFVENASLKAAGYATQTRLLTLADDSGLEVDELGGAPGVFSARYAGELASDTARIDALLAELAATNQAKRTARFVSAVAIAGAGGELLDVSLGTCEGHIAFAPRGSGGFGYDSVFIPNGFDLTFAELHTETKNQISHRARALQGAHRYLQSLTSGSGAG
jgi:XTP/dITP diphosphohydrolase